MAGGARRAHRAALTATYDRAMSRRALITGIGGQDGSLLAELLLGEGYEVVGVARGPLASYSNLTALSDRIELVEADLNDQESLAGALRSCRPDEVYNLASVSFVPMSWEQPVLTAELAAVGRLRRCWRRSVASVRRSASTRRRRPRSSASRSNRPSVSRPRSTR